MAPMKNMQVGRRSLLICSLFLLVASYPINQWLDGEEELDDPPSLEDRQLEKRTSDNSNSSSGNRTFFQMQCDITTVCPEGIANMIALGIAVFFITIFMCVVYYWESVIGKKTRVRLALERNRNIDRQIEEAKRKQEETKDVGAKDEGTLTAENGESSSSNHETTSLLIDKTTQNVTS
jgi:hypothetical protein